MRYHTTTSLAKNLLNVMGLLALAFHLENVLCPPLRSGVNIDVLIGSQADQKLTLQFQWVAFQLNVFGITYFKSVLGFVKGDTEKIIDLALVGQLFEK